jgi:hypothetical protein
MALALEQRDIHFLPDTVAIREMQNFGMTRLPTGIFRYGAVGTGHDDTVMARAFAWSQIAAVGYSGRGWLELAAQVAAEAKANGRAA